jgi:hypothetical protein
MRCNIVEVTLLLLLSFLLLFAVVMVETRVETTCSKLVVVFKTFQSDRDSVRGSPHILNTFELN